MLPSRHTNQQFWNRPLPQNGYSRHVVNRQLKELIRQNKALGGFEK